MWCLKHLFNQKDSEVSRFFFLFWVEKDWNLSIIYTTLVSQICSFVMCLNVKSFNLNHFLEKPFKGIMYFIIWDPNIETIFTMDDRTSRTFMSFAQMKDQEGSLCPTLLGRTKKYHFNPTILGPTILSQSIFYERDKKLHSHHVPLFRWDTKLYFLSY